MRDNDWDILVRSLQRQNCILFVGPDIRLTEGGRASACPDCLLAEFLVSDMGETWNETCSLPSVAFRYLQKFSRDDLQVRVEDFVRKYEPEAEYLAILNDLAALPFYLVITSLYDSVLQKAFTAQDKEPVVDSYDFRGGTPANLDIGTVMRPLIYQLHGAPGSQGHMVLTEQDLIDFLIAIVSKNPPLPPSIAAELQKPARSMLFIGFGIKHWYLRVLLHVLRAANPDSRSFALEAFDDVAPVIRDQMVFFYKSGHKLEIFDENVSSFAQELRRRFELLGGFKPQETAPSAFPGGDPPKIFLSYASEDEEFVAKVSDGLRKAGMNPWMDKDGGLAGGDTWNQVIHAEISHSDYFLSFQSQAMLNKTFSYVNTELALAKERQLQVRAPSRYLIPVQIGDSKSLHDLKDLQATRLHDPTDVRELVSLISRDYQRRRRT
jgi:hypothetical protein